MDTVMFYTPIVLTGIIGLVVRGIGTRLMFPYRNSENPHLITVGCIVFQVVMIRAIYWIAFEGTSFWYDPPWTKQIRCQVAVSIVCVVLGAFSDGLRERKHEF